MRPNNDTFGVVTSTLDDAESVMMTVDEAAMRYIMDLLTNLYSDPEAAVIREYATNAWDSHIEAGNTATPIEVSTPSPISPFFSVKDFGVGIDTETIKSLYSRYGGSTKRDDERQNGSMGVGSKSALAYASQFTFVGIKHGVRTEVSVGRNDKGLGEMKIVSVEPTDEPNGVEVIIPVKEYSRFAEKSQSLFKFWEPGTVLIDGKEPDRSDLKGFTDRIKFHSGLYDVVVMGNVAYPIISGQSVSRNTKRRVACYVTMNGDDEVVFTPSREALNYNPITTNALKGLREEFDEAVAEFIKDSIESADTHKDAIETYHEMKSIFGSMYVKAFLEWRGKTLEFYQNFTEPTTIKDYWGKDVHPARSVKSFNMGASRYAVSTSNYSFETLYRADMIIVGYPKDDIPSAYKVRIREYFRDVLGMTTTYGKTAYLFSQDDLSFLNSEWIDNTVTVEKWEDVLAATQKPKVPRVTTRTVRAGRYDVYAKGYSLYQQEDVYLGDNIHYYLVSDWGRHFLKHSRVDWVFDIEEDAKIVCIGKNQRAKLLRDFPNAKAYSNDYFLKLRSEKEFEEITDEQLEIMRWKYIYDGADTWNSWGVYDTNESVQHLDSLLDREYAGVLAAFNHDGKVPDTDTLSRHVPDFADIVKEWQQETPINFEERYPLMNWENAPKHTLEYINAVYMMRNKEN